MRQGIVHSQSRELPKKIKSEEITYLLLVKVGRIGSIERIFKGFTRFFGSVDTS